MGKEAGVEMEVGVGLEVVVLVVVEVGLEAGMEAGVEMEVGVGLEMVVVEVVVELLGGGVGLREMGVGGYVVRVGGVRRVRAAERGGAARKRV